MKFIKTIFFLIAVTASGNLFAQKYFYATLDISAPLSNKDWVSKGGAQALRIGYRSFINEKFSVGIDLGTVSYHEDKPYQTIENPNGAISTDFFNYIYSYSGVVSGQYNFETGDADRFLPYVGLGLGANRNEYVQYYNTYTDVDKAWGFLARPEAGILVKFGSRRSKALMAAVHYDYSTNSSSKFGYNSFSNVGFQLGIAFMEL